MENESPTPAAKVVERISPWSDNPDLRYKFWHLTIQTVSLIGAVIGVVLVLVSLHKNTKTLRNSVAQNVTGLVTGLDRMFIERPHLYPYFYEDVDPKELRDSKDPKERERYREIEAAATMVLDVLDVVNTQSTQFPEEWDTPEAWDHWVADEFARSPILCRVLDEHKNWYGPGLYATRKQAKH